MPAPELVSPTPEGGFSGSFSFAGGVAGGSGWGTPLEGFRIHRGGLAPDWGEGVEPWKAGWAAFEGSEHVSGEELALMKTLAEAQEQRVRTLLLSTYSQLLSYILSLSSTPKGWFILIEIEITGIPAYQQRNLTK